MIKLSRRVLARYVCDQLTAGTKPSIIAKQAMAELERSGRRNQWQMLLDDINYDLESRGLLTHATVSSAHPLSSGLQTKLEQFIKRLAGTKMATLRFETDERLVGGVRIESPTKVIDTTIQKQLLNLRKA